MPPIDLKQHPANLPSQPAGLTLADVYRYVSPRETDFTIPDVEPTNRPLTSQERAALIKLAFHVAQMRGADTIGGLTLEEMLRDSNDKMICPLTLELTSSELEWAWLRPHCDYPCVEAAPMDFLAQMLGWSPLDLWGRERGKQRLSNFVPITHYVAKTMQYGCHAAFVPTFAQLAKLIVELEARLATAITSTAGSDGTWELSTKFGASTALTSIEIDGDAAEPAAADRRGAPTVMYAHEYDFVGFPFSGLGPRKLVVHNDSLQDKPKKTKKHWGYSYDGGLAKFKPPLPSFASFISPAAAIASYVFRLNQEKINCEEDGEEEWEWREDQESHFDLCVYFCRLMTSVTSGASFAATLATRPQDDHLPTLASEVESCARDHAGDEEHKRKFPSFDPPLPADADRKRKRRESEGEARDLPHPSELRVYEVDRVSRGPEGSSGSAGYGDNDVFHSWRVAREGSKAHRECEEEVFRSAFWHYETAYNRHTRALVRAFDNGRGEASLFDLLSGGWEAFYQGCGEEQGKELRVLREGLYKRAVDLLEWLGKVVEHRRSEAS